jgi:hypothetical protein
LKLLDAIEQSIDRAMTALPDAIFRTRLHQEELAQLIVREMERQTRRSRGRSTVPTSFRVLVSAEDFEQIGLTQGELEMYLEGYLRKVALQRGMDFGGGFQVEAIESPDVKRRRPRITAEFSSAAPDLQPTRPTNSRPGRFFAALIPLNANVGRQQFVIPAGTTTIGRATSNHIALPSQYVSQHHARIEATDRTVRVYDLQSTNGTRVNGQPVTQWDLDAGDEVQFGDLRFRFDRRGSR